MFSLIRNWRYRRVIRHSPVNQYLWDDAFGQLPILQSLSADERSQLQNLAILFLYYKSIEAARGLQLTLDMKLTIALQACLPVLNLGFQWYNGWVSVIVYPAEFVPGRVYVDELGLEHSAHSVLNGESWRRGPVIISWEGSRDAGLLDGHNLIIHEFVHKLDMLNGAANGFPPMHKGMQVGEWSRAMSAAFQDLQHKVNNQVYSPIDEYAATSPAEFFAVLSEVFFERPALLITEYPHVYPLFCQFYRQDPLTRASIRASRSVP